MDFEKIEVRMIAIILKVNIFPGNIIKIKLALYPWGSARIFK